MKIKYPPLFPLFEYLFVLFDQKSLKYFQLGGEIYYNEIKNKLFVKWNKTDFFRISFCCQKGKRNTW